MSKNGTIDFAVYEDGREFLGFANVQLPDIVQKVLTVDVAGVAGTMEFPTGKVDAMTCTMNFHSVTPAAYSLSTMRQHIIELREVHQGFDAPAGSLESDGVKYIMAMMPKKVTLGQVQPASPQAVSGEYAVQSVKMLYNNELQVHVDPANNIFWDKDNGNVWAEYNKILGR